MNRIITLCLWTLLMAPARLPGQQTVKFIEPNISLTYDTSYFKIGTRYSNSVYETEAYDFHYTGAAAPHAVIHLKTTPATHPPADKTGDSSVIATINPMTSSPKDSVTIIKQDAFFRNIRGFSCAGFTAYHKKRKEYGTVIRGQRYSDVNDAEIYFYSGAKDLDSAYAVLSLFLQGIRVYTRAEIEAEERMIKDQYTVVVVPVSTAPEPYTHRPWTFVGLVSTKQPLQHTLSEVRLANTNGYEVFLPDSNGKTYILVYDKDKGNISKKGELLLLNKFGKKVKLPFSFTYNNTGGG